MNTLAKFSILLATIAIPSFAQAESLRFYDPSAGTNEPIIKEVTVNPNPANAAAAAADAARYDVVGSDLIATNGASGARVEFVYDPSADSGESNFKRVVIAANPANAAAAKADAGGFADGLIATNDGPGRLVYDPANDDANSSEIEWVPAGR